MESVFLAGNKMKAKIIQIQAVPSQFTSSAHPFSTVHYTKLFALCEDGTIWEWDSYPDDSDWGKLKLPGDKLR